MAEVCNDLASRASAGESCELMVNFLLGHEPKVIDSSGASG